MTDLSVITRSHSHSQSSDGLKIQVRVRHVLRKDSTISYVEYLTNLRDESWMHARGRYLEEDLLRDPD